MPVSARWVISLPMLVVVAATASAAEPPRGYYRMPSLKDHTVVFVAEGDLWKVADTGGVATRLTSHPGDEAWPAISPDGKTIAFTAQYEGPAEVYTMATSGGLPVRRTFDGARVSVTGWTPDGRVLAATNVYSTLPNTQLFTIDVSAEEASPRALLPLAQASDGVYSGDGRTLFFTRLPFQGSFTKRYKGGTAQAIWRFTDGDAEAVALTADFEGTSKRPMWWQGAGAADGRVFFLTDRDGAMNIWSMRPDGSDPVQHTRHRGFDAAGASLSDGRIVYQLGADLHVFDIAAGTDAALSITLDTDLDQMRENWVEKPAEYLTSVHVSPDGDRVALTARGRVFVAPHKQGRFIEVTPGAVAGGAWESVRCREARFMPDGKNLLVLADRSGEVEFWKLPASGVGEAEQLTTDGAVLRWDGVPSPDGKLVAHHDKNQRLFILNLETRENHQIDECPAENFDELRWSPDSRFVAYVWQAGNLFRQVKIYSVADGSITPLTSDRFDSYSPAWSPDGKWLYFLSDRNLSTLVESPWGPYQPEPFLANTTRLYEVALTAGQRSPFQPKDELQQDDKKPDAKDEKKTEPDREPKPEVKPETPPPAPAAEAAPPAPAAEAKKPDENADAKRDAKKVEVKIDFKGLSSRLRELPAPAGNYRTLSVNDKALFYLSSPVDDADKRSLNALTITNDNPEVKTVLAEVRYYELTADGKKLLIQKSGTGPGGSGGAIAIVDAAAAPADLDKKTVNLGAWSLSVTPRQEWRQMFTEAWRLERDYFYDTNMHGVDWKAMLEKYRPLVDRVTTRAELSDLISQMVAELSALHIFVNGGDLREPPEKIALASLGALLERDRTAGGYRVSHIYTNDPDEPERVSPLSRPGVDVKNGEIILAVNGVPTLSVPDIGCLLRTRAGKQVLLRVRAAAPADGTGAPAERDVIAVPITLDAATDLRYHEWEYTRRLAVERASGGRIGYLHLRAMGQGDYTDWAKGFYPVFNKEGLIIDVRHNRGGNIDSWIIEKLLRKAWFHWSGRVGKRDEWNMQYAFRGHIAVLCNERTASDGEAFSEGIKRLGIGTVIGTRTWGGEIWLSSSNFLVDRGIATAAEYGVYGPQGEWLIEGRGVEPDLVVDNPPHATFQGADAQLDAAVQHLLKKMADSPVVIPPVPPKPDKSFRE